MSSISKSFGVNSQYEELDILNSKELSKVRNIILIVIDGMGYEYLMNNGKNSALAEYFKKKITSVFPASTTSAIPSFATGVAPNQHGFTGWFMYLKEIGAVSKIVRFSTRSGSMPLDKYGLKMKDFFNQKTIFETIKAKSYVVQHKNYAYSEFSSAMMKGAKILPYSKLTGFFRQIKKAINTNEDRKYIYAYWDEFDTICHKHGNTSKKLFRHFQDIDCKLDKFLNSIKGSNTTIIITADHGLIDFTKSEAIQLDKHPKFTDTLIVPLCGDPRPRVAYCYVKPFKTKQFENYVKKNFKKYCWMYKSQDLVNKGYFGLFKPNKKFLDRIGDYMLVMKKNYVLEEIIPGDKNKPKKACHGGVSKEEMFIPVIIIK